MKTSVYVDGNSPLHRLHASTKLVLFLACFMAAYLIEWQQRWVALGVLFVGLWLCGVPPWRYKLLFLIVYVSTATVPLFQGLWPNSSDPVTFPLWDGIGFHQAGLTTGLASASLFGLMGMATIMWVTTTQPFEIAEAPSRLGVHHVVGFAVAYIFRYMPETMSRYLALADVWRTRGVVFNQGWIWDRVYLQCRLLAALLILEFSQVHSKSHAVAARGFSLKQPHTLYILPPVPLTEWCLMAGAGAVIVGLACFQLWHLIS